MNIFELESIFIIFLMIQILLTMRNYMYKIKNLKVWFGEDIIFLISFFASLFIIGYYTKQNFIMLLSFPFISYLLADIILGIIKKFRRKN